MNCSLLIRSKSPVVLKARIEYPGKNIIQLIKISPTISLTDVFPNQNPFPKPPPHAPSPNTQGESLYTLLPIIHLTFKSNNLRLYGSILLLIEFVIVAMGVRFVQLLAPVN